MVVESGEDFVDLNSPTVQRAFARAEQVRQTGIRNIKAEIEELEKMPPWRNDPLGICYQARLDAARNQLAQLESVDART